MLVKARIYARMFLMLRKRVTWCNIGNMPKADCQPPPTPSRKSNTMDIDFTQYDPNDNADYEALMEIIADNPGEDYDWAKLAEYGIEHSWMQFVWGWDDEPAETPRMTTREFMYSNR